MILEKGKLRERVKAGEVKASEARLELLALKRAGRPVSEAAIRWLSNFDSRRSPLVKEEQPKKRRKGRRRKERNAKLP